MMTFVLRTMEGAANVGAVAQVFDMPARTRAEDQPGSLRGAELGRRNHGAGNRLRKQSRTSQGEMSCAA